MLSRLALGLILLRTMHHLKKAKNAACSETAAENKAFNEGLEGNSSRDGLTQREGVRERESDLVVSCTWRDKGVSVQQKDCLIVWVVVAGLETILCL